MSHPVGAEHLPPGWTAHVDPSSGKTFYVQVASGTSQWNLPHNPVPPPPGPPLYLPPPGPPPPVTVPPVIPTAAGGGDQTAIFQFASRVVSQDDVEDGDVLVPITGLNKTFAKLAAACIQHIIDASPEFAAKVEAEGGWKIRIKAAEMFARKIVKNPDRNPYKLLVCFIMAIHLYTQEWVLYKELNACLRSRDRKRLLPFFPYLRLLLTAFSCIPPSAVTVFRGVKKDLAGKFVKGEQAVWWSVTSTTTSMGTLQEEMFLGKSGKRTMFCIASKTFRDIRHYSAIGVEAECCGLPGTCLDIDDLLDQGDLQIVQMTENIADCMLDFVPDVAAYVALEASDVAPAAPPPAVFSAPFAPSPVAQTHATAQAASSAISSLNVKHVSLLVKSVKPTFTKYAAAVVEHDVSGVFILKATDDELSALFDQMHVALPHKVELREAVRSWRANPEQALQAIDRELRAEEAAAAQAAADKKAREEAAAAHEKAEQLRKAEEQRQMEQRRKAEAAEAERKAEEARKAAAATPARSIVHNGHVYKSLADHDPHSTTAINECKKLYNLDPPWELCPNTPDALHVCKTYPWAAYALVFADGSAHWTALAPSWHAPLKPGTQAASSGCLRQQGGQYGIVDPRYRCSGVLLLHLLIRRKL